MGTFSYKLYRFFWTSHSCSVTSFTFGFRLFFYSAENKLTNKNYITPATGKERGDVEIRDYVVFQKPRDLTDCLPPPRTLILDFTLTIRVLEDHICLLLDR